MEQEQMTAFVLDLFESVWVTGDQTKVEKFYSRDIELYIGQKKIGFEEIFNRVGFIKQNFTDMNFKFHEIIPADNKCVAHYTQSYLENGKKVTKNMMGICYFNNNKISKLCVYVDHPIEY